jgi:hypothetical protein
MAIVDYFDKDSGTRKKKHFAYTAQGLKDRKAFTRDQSQYAKKAGKKQPSTRSGIKSGTPSPARSGHTGPTIKPGDHHPPATEKKKVQKTYEMNKDLDMGGKRVVEGIGFSPLGY